MSGPLLAFSWRYLPLKKHKLKQSHESLLKEQKNLIFKSTTDCKALQSVTSNLACDDSFYHEMLLNVITHFAY